MLIFKFKLDIIFSPLQPYDTNRDNSQKKGHNKAENGQQDRKNVHCYSKIRSLKFGNKKCRDQCPIFWPNSVKS